MCKLQVVIFARFLSSNPTVYLLKLFQHQMKESSCVCVGAERRRGEGEGREREREREERGGGRDSWMGGGGAKFPSSIF